MSSDLNPLVMSIDHLSIEDVNIIRQKHKTEIDHLDTFWDDEDKSPQSLGWLQLN